MRRSQDNVVSFGDTAEKHVYYWWWGKNIWSWTERFNESPHKTNGQTLSKLHIFKNVGSSIWTYSCVLVPHEEKKLFFLNPNLSNCSNILLLWSWTEQPVFMNTHYFPKKQRPTHSFVMRHILGQLCVKCMEDWFLCKESVRVFPELHISFIWQGQHSARWWRHWRNHFLHQSVLNKSEQGDRSNQFKGCVFPLICLSL